MNGISTAISDVKVISSMYFVEQYNAERYKAAGIMADFVQDNESSSADFCYGVWYAEQTRLN